jgi:hypothetical protein
MPPRFRRKDVNSVVGLHLPERRELAAGWGRARRAAVERLRDVVRVAGSQSALAEALGEPRSTVSAWFARKPSRLLKK